MKISIEHYIATNNPKEVAAILTKRGIPAPKNIADAIKKLKFVMSKEGNAVTKELANIETPYQALILSTQDDNSEDKSNACGCSGFDGEKKSNCSGDCSCNKKSNATGDEEPTKAVVAPAPAPTPTETTKDALNKHAPIIALGLLLVISTAVLMKK